MAKVLGMNSGDRSYSQINQIQQENQLPATQSTLIAIIKKQAGDEEMEKCQISKQQQLDYEKVGEDIYTKMEQEDAEEEYARRQREGGFQDENEDYELEDDQSEDKQYQFDDEKQNNMNKQNGIDSQENLQIQIDSISIDAEPTISKSQENKSQIIYNNLGPQSARQSTGNISGQNQNQSQRVQLIQKRSIKNSRENNSKNKKNRKIRTTITKQKLAEMNRIFGQYTANKQEGKNPKFNLKEIGIQLQLGYSTILHKFRQFRANKKVKGGALIASLQKKRKYRKSVEIEQIIELALSERPFFTAVQLSNYIRNKYQRNFSRSIISRHLGQMGYSYKNLKATPIQKNKPKYKQVRKLYAHIIEPILNCGSQIVYVDQMACNLANFTKKKGQGKQLRKSDLTKQDQEYVSVMVAATSQTILHQQVRSGFFERQDFLDLLAIIRSKIAYSVQSQNQTPLIIVMTDINKIHRDIQDEDEPPMRIQAKLRELNMQRYFLPPSSPQLNPLQSLFMNVKNKISKKDIHNTIELKQQLIRYMRQLQTQTIDVHFKDIPIWLEKSKKQENF